MKLFSWNVNGVRAIEKKGFLDWFSSESPDILCIQETKAKFEVALIKDDDDQDIEEDLIKLGANKIDYLENYNTKSIKKIKKPNKKYNLFFAYYIKKVRLIDNI